MRFDPQIPSRFEQMELPIWTESEELRRFIAGYLATLSICENLDAIDQRFIEYLLALSNGCQFQLTSAFPPANCNP